MNSKTGFGLAVLAVLLLGVFGGMASYSGAQGDGYSSAPEINYLYINTTVSNNYAVTEISEELKNPSSESVDETFSIQVPEGAFISNFSLTIDGRTHYAKVVSKDYGREKYDEAVSTGSDAALVESDGRSVFSYSVSLSPGQVTKVGLRYEEFIEKSLGGYEYKMLLSSLKFNNYIKKLESNFELRSALSIDDINSPGREKTAIIKHESSNRAVVVYSQTMVPPGSALEDIVVNYQTAAVNINGKIFNYNDGESGYFSHVFSPQPDDLGGAPMAKDIIFVLDKSGSMSGTKIDQLKDAFDEIVHELRGNDNFNIIYFDSIITNWGEGLITASDSNKDTAANFINEIDASGGTNINDALTTGLDMFGDTTETVPIIVFLTDGLPTSGTTSTSSIRQNILNHNEEEVSIFSLGFGYDVDFEFLKALSLENGGQALRIEEGTAASLQMTNFYDTISTPLLKDLNFDYAGGVSEVYPTYVDQLFEGTEVVIVGKYNLSTTQLNCNVRAKSSEGDRIFSQSYELKDNTEYSFVPRLWAYTKIHYLLDEITVSGYDETIVGEIVNLALEYEFVTPYTSLLITVEEPKADEPKADEEPPVSEKSDDTTGSGKTTYGSGTDLYPTTIIDTDGDGVRDDYDSYPYNPTDPKTQPPKDDGKSSDDEREGSYGLGKGSSFGLIGIFIGIIAFAIILTFILILRLSKVKN